MYHDIASLRLETKKGVTGLNTWVDGINASSVISPSIMSYKLAGQPKDYLAIHTPLGIYDTASLKR